MATKTGIYSITNKVNGKIYVGQSIDVYRRWGEHKSPSQRTNHSNYPIYRALNKYGLDNFSFEIIELCEMKNLDLKEEFWIKALNSHKNGYNVTMGGKLVYGSLHPRATLVEKDVFEIRARRANKDFKVDVYNDYNMNINTFNKIWQNKTWNNVIVPEAYTEEINDLQNKRRLDKSIKAMRNKNDFSDEMVVYFRNRYVNESAKKIFKDYHGMLSFITFQQIVNGTTRKNLPYYHKKEGRWFNGSLR